MVLCAWRSAGKGRGWEGLRAFPQTLEWSSWATLVLLQVFPGAATQAGDGGAGGDVLLPTGTGDQSLRVQRDY